MVCFGLFFVNESKMINLIVFFSFICCNLNILPFEAFFFSLKLS